MLRNHAAALAGIIVSLALCLVVVGCQVTTQSTREPGHKVDAVGLANEATETQADLDKEAASIENATANYNAHIKSANAKLTAAGNDLAAKEKTRQQLVSAVGGIVPAILSGRGMDPTTYTSAFITLLALGAGGGSMVDSARKNSVISRLRLSQTSDPAAPDVSAGTLPAAAAAAPPVNKA